MRLEGWEHRLSDFIAEVREASFVWGRHDCCLMACDAIRLLIGRDPGEGYRGKYSSAEQAQEILDREGGVGGIARRVTEEMGFREMSRLQAMRGDVGLALIPDETLGVCIGRYFAFPRQEGGLAYVRISSPQIAAVWRIE